MTTVKARRRYYRMVSALLVLLVLVVTEWLGRSGLISPLLVPTPSSVWQVLYNGFSKGLYWPHITSTIVSTLLGFVLSTLIAFVVAGLLASSRALEEIFLPYIVAFQTLPKIAIAPLIIIWMGFGQQAKVTVVAITCFFPILVNTLQGLRVRDRDQYELMQSLGATRFQLLRYMRMQNALPYIFAGLNIGIVYSLIGAITAEFVGSSSGLGYILLIEQGSFNVPAVFAILLILMIFGVLMHLFMRFVESKTAFWSSTRDIQAS